MPKTATTTPKPAAAKAPRKPRATTVKKPEAEMSAVSSEQVVSENQTAPEISKPVIKAGRYVFATGRRKTAIANVRLFSGTGDILVNRKPLKDYFNFSDYQEEILKPFQVTGLGKDYYFTASVSGGGMHAQAQAVRHGIATALSQGSLEIRTVLKKNGFLTRDPREKERKKPGLKRARRSPQWAKR